MFSLSPLKGVRDGLEFTWYPLSNSANDGFSILYPLSSNIFTPTAGVVGIVTPLNTAPRQRNGDDSSKKNRHVTYDFAGGYHLRRNPIERILIDNTPQAPWREPLLTTANQLSLPVYWLEHQRIQDYSKICFTRWVRRSGSSKSVRQYTCIHYLPPILDLDIYQ